ncbi:MAG TPA: hypothetical protein PKY55_02935 [bacterium]|nr:hypothetical protein [bacterium]
MQVYFFTQHGSWQRSGASAEELHRLLERIAAETDTADLVVAVHLVRRSRWSGGTAFVRQWHHPAAFFATRGKWRLGGKRVIPPELPARFKLIRLLLQDDGAPYPMTQMDRYGWQHRFERFSDHLAFFFAHELHHFRRYHLGLHPREGEHSANGWALAHCRELGVGVASQRPGKKKARKRAHRGPAFWQLLNPIDFLPAAQAAWLWRRGGALLGMAVRLGCGDRDKYVAAKMEHIQRLGAMTPGVQLWITFDPGQRYRNAPVRLVRQMRRPSLRAVIETGDGKTWRWPLAWLSPDPPAG